MKDFNKYFVVFMLGLLMAVLFTRVTGKDAQMDLVLLALLIYFSVYLKYVIGSYSRTSVSEPLWVSKTLGYGISLNPRNPIGFWICLAVTLAVIAVSLVLLVIMLLGK